MIPVINSLVPNKEFNLSEVAKENLPLAYDIICRLGDSLDYQSMKNLAFCLRTSDQFEGERTNTRRPYLVDFLNHQLSSTQERVSKYFKFLIGSLHEGDELATKILIGHELFDSLSPEHIDAVFFEAAQNGNLKAMKAIQKKRGPTSKGCEAAFEVACQKGLLSIVQFMMSDPWLLFNSEKGFLKACENDQLSIVHFLKNLIGAWVLREGFTRACSTGRASVVEALLKSPRIDAHIVGRGFITACDSANENVMTLLMNHPLLDANSKGDGFINLCLHNHAALVKIMMNDPQISEGSFQVGFRDTSDVNIVKLLMNDQRLNRDSISMKFSVGCKYDAPLVEVLIGHEKLNDISRQYGLYEACRNGNEVQVRLLMNHPDIREADLRQGIQDAKYRRKEKIVTLLEDELQKRASK